MKSTQNKINCYNNYLDVESRHVFVLLKFPRNDQEILFIGRIQVQVTMLRYKNRTNFDRILYFYLIDLR